MTILYVSDEKYAHLLGVSLTSVCVNNKEEKELYFFVIDNGISEENKIKIKNTVNRYGREVLFFSVNGTIPLKKIGRWSANIFCRIFFESIIGKDLIDDRIIYLDCDTVVVDDLKELWEIDLNGNICAAVYECMGERHKKKSLLSSACPYFNSGMLLIDVQKWSEANIEEKAQEILEINTGTKMEYPDEGLLNNLLQRKIKIVGPKYNLTTIKCVFTYEQLRIYRKSKYMYSEKEYSEAKDSPCIIHYTNNFLVSRPWYSAKGEMHPLADYYYHYKKESEWKDIELLEEHVSFFKKIARKLFSINQKICVYITGWIYEYIKPLKYNKLIMPK